MTSTAPVCCSPSISTRKRALTKGSRSSMLIGRSHRLLDALDALVHEFQCFDEHVVPIGVEVARVVFDGPCCAHHVASHVRAGFVENDYDDVLAIRCDLAIDN